MVPNLKWRSSSGPLRWSYVLLAAFRWASFRRTVSGGVRKLEGDRHEPSWSITRTNSQLIFETDFGATRRDFPLPPADRIDAETVSYLSSTNGFDAPTNGQAGHLYR